MVTNDGCGRCSKCGHSSRTATGSKSIHPERPKRGHTRPRTAGKLSTIVARKLPSPAPRTRILVFFFECQDLDAKVSGGLGSLSDSTPMNKGGLLS